MSAVAFQQLQARMVLDPAVALRVAQGDLGDLADDLSEVEAARLRAQAADAGLALCHTLHEGWRLTKLLTLLPIVFAVGDADELARLVRDYWSGHRPRGLRFEREAAEFADLVAETAGAGTLLHDAARVQAALLRLPEPAPGVPDTVLELAHDPRPWLAGAVDVPVPAGRFRLRLRPTPEGAVAELDRTANRGGA